MKREQLRSLLIVAAVLAICGLGYQFYRSFSWEGGGSAQLIFPDLKVNDVSKIVLKSSAVTVTLQKDHSRWKVIDKSGYPADYSKIRDFLRDLWQLKAVRTMQVGPSQFARLHIGSPKTGSGSGTEVSLLNADGKNLGLFIAGKTMQAGESEGGSAGQFLYKPSTKDRVYLISQSLYTLDPLEARNWLDKSFVSAGDLREVQRKDGTAGWQITRSDKNGGWKLTGAAAGETLKEDDVNRFNSFSPTFEDVFPATISVSQTGLDHPVETELKTFDGFTYQLAIGREGENKTRYLRIRSSAQLQESRKPAEKESPEEKSKQDEAFGKELQNLRDRAEREKAFAEWVYLVPDYSIEELLKPRAEIVNHASPLVSPAPAAGNPASGSSPLLSLPAPAGPASVAPNPLPSAAPSSSPVNSPTPAAAPVPGPPADVGAAPAATSSAVQETKPAPSPSPVPVATSTPAGSSSPAGSPEPSASPSPAAP